MTGLDVALGALLTFRLVRLWQDDAILAPISDRVYRTLDRRAHDSGPVGAASAWLLDLLGCPWCLSVWIGAAVYAGWVYLPTVWYPSAYVATFSAATGLLAARDG